MSIVQVLAGLLLSSIGLLAADPAWGLPNNGIRLAAAISSEPGRVLTVSFQNVGEEGTKLVVGRSTSNGPFYSLTFGARNGDSSQSCKITNSLGGVGVAGFVEPIVIRLDPSAIRRIEIPLLHLTCIEKGSSTLGWMLISGYSIKVGFAMNSRQASIGGPGKSWSGQVGSGLASIY